MDILKQMQVKKAYVSPELSVIGSLSELTQAKELGSGDSFILSITNNPNIPAIDVTHYYS